MSHAVTKEDRAFKRQVEACEFPVAEFDHRAHLRLAYVYLCSHNPDRAVERMRDAILGQLRQAGVDPAGKYHQTMTEAWILAVHHFLNKTECSESADDFISQNPMMLDPKIMLTHYSAELLFSEEAWRSFVEPNLDPIPRNES